MMSATDNNTVRSSSPESLPMHEPLRVVSYCLERATLDMLKGFAGSATLLKLHGNLDDYGSEDHEPIPEWMGESAPDICLVDFDRDRSRAAAVAERLHARVPGAAVFAVSSQSEPALLLEAMRAGCTEYLVKPLDRDQMVCALARVVGRKKERTETTLGQVFTFVGAKGGCGVTSLVTQMGAMLAKSCSRNTVVLDFHPDSGDVALYLGLTKARYNLFELLENNHRLDGEFLQSFVIKHSSGVDIIPAPDGTDMAAALDPGTLTRTLEFLRLRYEFILVDLHRAATVESLELIRAADQHFVITIAEVAAVRNVVRHVEFLNRSSIAPEKIHVVLNRHEKNAAIQERQIEKAIGQRIHWKIPNQPAQVMKTITGGDPVMELAISEVARSVNEWAGSVGKKPGPENKKKDGRKLFGLLSR